MTRNQVDRESEEIIKVAEILSEKQLLASIVYELKKIRKQVKSVELELSVIKQQLKR